MSSSELSFIPKYPGIVDPQNFESALGTDER